MKQSNSNSDTPAVLSYLFLRKLIGILGILFPIVLWIGTILFSECEGIQGSISAYYHTIMRNLFVGILCAVAFFLFAYKGYDKRDIVAAKLASLFALGVAFFPTSMKESIEGCNFKPIIENPSISYIHLGSAALFFITLSYISLFLFTKSKFSNKVKKQKKNLFNYVFANDLFKKSYTNKLTVQKKYRNRIYIICGIIMLFAISMITLYMLFLKDKYPVLVKLDPVFWLEALALWAFGLSWLTKGETLFKDKKS